MLARACIFAGPAVDDRFGRDLYAVGGNAEAARLAGIPIGRTIVVAYAMCGLCAGDRGADAGRAT